MSDILPEKKKVPTQPTSLRLPTDLLAELNAIASESGYKRSEVIIRFLRKGAEMYREQTKRRK